MSTVDRLVVCAIFSGLIYLLIFTLPFPLIKFYRVIPPVDYTKLTNYSPRGFLLYTLGIITLFLLYFWAIRLTQPDDAANNDQNSGIPPKFIFSSSAIFAIILIFSYPLTAIDLFIYAIRTRGWALYNLQPLATSPNLLPNSDPWLGLAGEWVDAASPYGPLWEFLSLGAFYLSGGNFLAHLFMLKIIGALAYLGCVWLIYKTLTHIQPKWTLAGTLAFAWNPLVLFESIQNAHNDIMMIFFLLAAVLIFTTINKQITQQRIIGLSLLLCLLLALSVLVKFVTIIVTPILLLALASQYPTWLRRLIALIGYSLFTLMLIVAPMIPFWPGQENWAVLKAGSGAGRSLMALLVLGLRDWLGTNTAFDLSRNIILILFGLICLYLLWPLLKNFLLKSPISQSPNLPISTAFYFFFWYVLLAIPVFHAWYLLWFLPLASLLLPLRRPLVAAVTFSITALLIIPYFETIRVWYPFLLQNHFVGHLIGVPLLIVPPAIALLWPIRPALNSEV